MARKKEETQERTEVNQKQFKLSDSYGSLIAGLVVVVVVIGILIFALRGDKNVQDTSSIQDDSKVEETAEDVEADENGQKLYTVKKGDDLWNIAESVYKDGYKWTEIVKANKITNPNLIAEGDKLVIPDLEKTKSGEDSKEPESEVEPTVVPEAPVESKVEQKKEEKITGDKYTVKKGEHLWGIAVRAYGDGYKWVNVAKANKLTNPDVIHSGNVLNIPR